MSYKVSIATCIYTILIIFSLARDYSFEVDISIIPWSGTVDEVFYRLCNIDDKCGLFQSVPAGWQTPGQTYQYTYTTKTNIGDIYKVQIVHPGSDMLCIDHIKVDGTEYDENGDKWIDMPHCIEEADGGGCDTVTILLPNNFWSSVLTIPCEYESILRDTYEPTPAPSSTTSTPTATPTPAPTALPTRSPSKEPTEKPTKYPSVTPTKAPTPFPTSEPTVSPTREPSASPVVQSGGVNPGGGGQGGLTNSEEQDGNGAIIGGIIGGLTAALLCICLGVIILCWYMKKKRMDDEVEEVNGQHRGKSIDAASTVSHQPVPIMIEGVSTGFTGTTKVSTNGYLNGTALMGVYDEGSDNESPINQNMIRIGSQENVQLIADSEDENDATDIEGLYDNNRRNITKRIPSSEEDEDVVPQ